MLLETILIVVTLAVLVIASYTDIKTREVPDYLTYGFLFAVLGVRLIFAIEQGWFVFWSALLGFAIFFGIALLLYYTHQWGGADSKLLMGMGAVLGVAIPFSSESFTPLFFLILLLFVGAVYGLIWILVVAIRNHTKFFPLFKEKLKHYKKIHLLVITITLAFIALTIFNPLFLPLLFFPPLIFYILMVVTIVEKNFFVKSVAISKLTEGDWLAKTIMHKDDPLFTKRTLEKKDIAAIHDLSKKYHFRTVSIKEGIPFVPSFLISYVIILVAPNLFSFF